MKILFFKPTITTGNIKCTIHKNGKLGFSRQAIYKLKISDNNYAKIGINAENKSEKNLYLIIQGHKDEETFKINKAGDYYYINTKYLFDELHIDYSRKKIIFDIQEIKTNGNTIYRLNKREVERKRSKVWIFIAD